tara:strand:- start:1151 stop:3529 length:2379 start_codon:yes stop_codon:yes gene_type:complete
MQQLLLKNFGKNKKYFFIFPSYVFNFFSSSALLIIIYFSKLSYLAADFGLVTSLLFLICHILSFNERSVLLSDNNLNSVNSAFIFRIQSTIILIFVSLIFFKAQNLLNLFTLSISVLIISQWCFEIFLIKCEITKNFRLVKIAIICSFLYILVSAFSIFNGNLNFFCIFTIFYNFTVLLFCFFKFEKIYLIIDFSNYYQFFLKKNLLSYRLTSSFFISISNFYFRYFIYILFSKEVAGSLFTFFTFGSFPASVYSLVLAPSFLKDKINIKKLKIFSFAISIYFFIGLILLYLFFSNNNFSSQNFLIAGLSIIGSVIMIYSLNKRQFMIYNFKTRSFCFQLDIFYSISVICIIPLIYSINNEYLLPGGFLISSILAYIFYGLTVKSYSIDKILIFSILIFIPIYVILFKNNIFDPYIYYAKDPFFNASFNLNILPIPLSFFVVAFLFILIIKKQLIESELLYILSLVVILGLTSVSLVKYNLKSENIFNLVQFAFPLTAFIIGNEFAKFPKYHLKFFKVIFFIQLFIIVFQLFDSFLLQSLTLSSNISGIGIYKHLQFISQFVAITFLVCISYLHTKEYINNVQTLCLILLTNIYLILSTSISGLIFIVIFSILLIFLNFKNFFKLGKNYVFILLIFLSIILLLKFQYDAQDSYEVETTYFKIINFLPLLSDRISSIFYYLNAISNLNEFLLGKNNINESNPLFSTSFNYFVDYIYNFGFLTLLPLLYLIYAFFKKFVYYLQDPKSNFVVYSSFIIIVFLLVDTFIKSSLREIYVGNVFYFLWGFTYYSLRSK